MTMPVHPEIERALATVTQRPATDTGVVATIKPPKKLAGGADLAMHGDAEDVLAQVGQWIERHGMVARGVWYDCFGIIHQDRWSLRQPELVADVTDATSLPGPAGECIDVYPEAGVTPQIPVTVRLVRLLLIGEPARWVATFGLEGGD
jgi:hypothetical protein